MTAASPPSLAGRRILLVIAGGIAAYKSLDLIRRLRDAGAAVPVVMTAAAQHFITPMAAASLAEEPVFTDLWSLKDETEMGHIRLSREADLILVAPATADLMARMAAGLADDLATTVLLASDKPVMIAPSMNTRMWQHPATVANLATLAARGVRRVGPGSGDLACGETGDGRMAEPLAIVAAVAAHFGEGRRLAGRRALVTSGPTFEPIDPVRFIGNRSSGRQGHAVAAGLAALGAEVVLVSGPSHEPVPEGAQIVRVETACQMLDACQAALPVEIAVCAAAVGDWRVADTAPSKLKKGRGGPPTLTLVENPDILATLARAGDRRPALVVGFAAETDHVLEYAAEKRRAKGCDWILANDVSPGTGIFGGETNRVHLVTEAGIEDWPELDKRALGLRLAHRIADQLGLP